MTAEQIYAIEKDAYGWRNLPKGNRVKLGNDVTLGKDVTLGDRVKIGNDVKIGDGVMLGNDVMLGNGVTLGNWVTLGDVVTLGNGVMLGNGVTLGNWVTLGNGVTCNNSPLQIQGPEFLVYPSSKSEIGIGCEIHTYDFWCKHGQQIADDHGVKIDDYIPYVDMVRDWLTNNWERV